MAQEDIEQKIKLTFENNADENAKEVDKLTASIDKTTESQDKTVKENSKVENSFKSLKVQLREATVEQQRLSAQYGSTSKEAITATKAVAKLKDEIGFQKDLVASYNPDEKFRGLTQTAGIAAIALGGVSDGFKALGIESKALDQVIGTAQAILGVTSAVAAMSDAYEILTATKKAKAAADIVEVATTEAVTVAEVQATTATWSWNAALLANPIVLITAGIIAAGAAIYAFAKITSNAVSEQERAKVASMQLSKAIENQSKAFENNNNFLSKNNDHKIAMLRASGASEKQIYAETKALGEQELQLAKNYRAEALLAEQKAYEANRSNPTEFNAKTLADAKENIAKAEKAVSVGYDGLISLQQNHEVAVVQAQTDARTKAAESAQKARDEEAAKVKAERAKEIEDLKAFNADVLRAKGEMNVAKVNQDIQDKIDEDARKKEGVDKAFEAGDAAQAEVDKQLAKDKEIADAMLKQEQEIQDAKISIAQRGIQLIANIFGKSKAVQKAAIIAENAIGIGKMIIANNTANVAALATPQAIATSGASAVPVIALNNISTGIGVASSIAATAKALKAVGGGSAGSGGSQSSGGRSVSVGASATPQVNFQASSENQIGNTVAGRINAQPPIKVTVLESDITKTQTSVQAKVVSNSF